MSNQSIITLEKPMQHLALSDWHSRVNTLRNVADARRKDAFDVRQASCTLRNETRIETNWTNYNSNEALSERITELHQWQETLKILYKRLETEIKLLEEEKASTERELDALQTPLSVISECLTTRDGRVCNELTYDNADLEIKNELAIVENNQHMLMDQCKKAWEKLTRLQEVKLTLGIHLENAIDACALDTAQLDLNKFSSLITFKTNPRRSPKNCCTYEAWKDHTKNIKELAKSELADTYAIREALFVCREKARNALYAQQDQTEYTLRKRIFETQRLRNEIEWQKLKMQNEMKKALSEIRTLEQELQGKTGSLKLSETRLENRAQRPGMELCLDSAHNQLCLEVEKLQRIRQRLKGQIEEAKANYNSLEEHATKIDVDLEKKQHSLMTDIRTLDLRKRLKGGEFGKQTQVAPSDTDQTERNIILTQMEKEIPKNVNF